MSESKYLNESRKQKLDKYLMQFLPEVVSNGYYVDKFDYIFDDLFFYNETKFDYIFDIIEHLNHKIKVENLPIKSLTIRYSLEINTKTADFNFISESNLLKNILETSESKRIRITPPTLILHSNQVTNKTYCISNFTAEAHLFYIDSSFFKSNNEFKSRPTIQLLNILDSFSDIDDETGVLIYSTDLVFRLDT
jgi:hypothetical protein